MPDVLDADDSLFAQPGQLAADGFDRQPEKIGDLGAR